MNLKIKIRNLQKKFGSNTVLNNLNLEIFENESLAIIGESGSGKSVLTKCINGLTEYNNGKIIYENSYDVKNLKTEEKGLHISKFGVLFQNSALFDSLDVEKNIFFSCSGKKDLSILKDVGLDKSVLPKMPAEISVGVQKRVGLARAIMSKPKILIFDEPTTGLDPIIADQINKLIRDLVIEKKLTTITITHDMKSVYEYADKVAFIRNGKIEWYGQVKQLKNCKNIYMKNFISGKIK